MPFGSRFLYVVFVQKLNLLLHCFSGLRVGSPTFVIIVWIEMLKLDLVTKWPFIGKGMNLVLMLL